MSATFQATYHLMLRSLRETIRQPAVEVGNLFIPVFFFFVTVGAIGGATARAFGVDNYEGFQLPVAILQGVAGASSSSGLGMTMDIERGYFDKLLLTPAPRLALVLGRLAADAVRVMVLTVVILAVGLIAGVFGLAYSGIGLAIALRTGSAQAAQLGFLVFFPLIFLSPALAPKEVFSGWLEFLATINPVTYIVEGTRSLVLDGWDAAALAYAVLAIVGFGAVTLSPTLMALRTRTS